jgi:uncharacterized membrane protein
MFGERGRWAMVALGASILLNLFLAGVVVGRLTVPGWSVSQPPNAGAILGLFPRAQIRELPFSEKNAFWAAMRGHAAEVRAAHARLLEARREVIAAIGAPVFDRAKLDAKLVVLRQAALDQQVAGEKAAADGLAVLNAQSRAAIARDATERMDAQGSR